MAKIHIWLIFKKNLKEHKKQALSLLKKAPKRKAHFMPASSNAPQIRCEK